MHERSSACVKLKHYGMWKMEHSGPVICWAATVVMHDMMMPQFDQIIGPRLALRLGAAHAACRGEAPRVDIPRLFCIACACVQPSVALRRNLAALEWLYKLDAIKS